MKPAYYKPAVMANFIVRYSLPSSFSSKYSFHFSFKLLLAIVF